MSRRLSDDANLSLDNEQSLLSVKFDAQVLKKKMMWARRAPTFREPHCHSSARRANIFIYLLFFSLIFVLACRKARNAGSLLCLKVRA